MGTVITSDGRSKHEINTRIGHAKTAFKQMYYIFRDKNISMELKKRLVQCFVEPILMYGCESWTVDGNTRKRLEAVKIWFLRRMLRIPWTDRKRNEEVLEMAEYRRDLMNRIEKRKARFFGHIMRRDGMESIVTTGMFEGRRARGRQRMKIIDDLTTWIGTKTNRETFRATTDREKWRTLITNATKQGT